jgi:hypothetical protein
MTVLRVQLADQQLCSFAVSELPAEKEPVAALRSGQDTLDFVDSADQATSFDLSTVFEEDGRYLHMSVRVSPGFGVQADAIITETDVEDSAEAFKNGAKAIRFQPFFLRESNHDPADLIGKGLFARGLHFSGVITPANVSSLCLCDFCRKTFRLDSFHAGFSDSTYLYCSGGPHTLVASSYLEDAPPVLGEADMESVARFERRLPPCSECGGSFRYLNPLLCPHCRAPFIDFARYPQEREKEYYGNTIYGERTQVFEESTS